MSPKISLCHSLILLHFNHPEFNSLKTSKTKASNSESDVIGSLAGGGQADAGILRHAFGAKQDSVEQALSANSGIDAASVAKILAMVAPLVMGALGKAQRDQGLDAAGTAAMVQCERRTAEKQAPQAMDMLGRLLDSDGDGSVMDDVARMGSSLFKSFLN
jgi:hypothetical protein